MAEQFGPHSASTVFVSYAHESEAFRTQVKQLCDWLRSQGVAVVCDFDHAVKPPSKGWAIWMQHAVEDARVVLVVASPKYKARFEKRAAPDSGKGVAWEGAIITQDLYDAAQRNDKFFPILPDGGSHDDVPKALKPWDNGHWFPSGQAGILGLIRECENPGTVLTPPIQNSNAPLVPIQSTTFKTMTTTHTAPVIVLMTVNDNETQALWDVFLGAKKIPVQHTEEGVTYSELGIHGGKRVVHTVCKMGTTGIGAAQQRAGHAIDHFAPKAVIAVGIAFGVDETKQTIGDVLVSTQIQDYELARLNPKGEHTPRSDRPCSADVLINLLMQTDAAQKRPGEKWPEVRFGLVLSGQKLVDNFKFRERLKKQYSDAIGGEMEGAGLYASAHEKKTDWLVIKAICDWGRDKNSAMKDTWQKLAAKNAAVVLKAALDVDGLYGAKSAPPETTPAAVPKKRDQSKPVDKTTTPKVPASKPLPSDAERLTDARLALQTYLGCDELKAITALNFVDNLPKAVSDALLATAGQLTRKAMAENCMQAILKVAKTYADYVGSLSASSPVAPTKKQCKNVRTRLINAMQAAILLSARQEKMLKAGAIAACDASSPCKLDVGSVLAAIVQLRVGNLATQLKAEFPEGRPTVWKDAGHLHGFDVVEMGTVEENGGVSGAKTEFLKVLYRHLYPAETTFPDFANNSNARESLLSEVRQRKIDGEHLLILLEGQGKTISSVLFKWMIEDTHIGVVSITTTQGVFEVSEGTWTALLVRLFEALQPFEK